MFPVVIVKEAGGSVEQASFLVSMSMVAGGIGVIVQAFSKGPIGAGYLCPQVCGPSFLTASILAAQTGGLSLVLGMTTIAGVLGGMGQSTSSSNIGLSIATGVTSRVLAYSMGGILIGMSFFPKLSAVFAIMPKPVMGATLIFALSFMVIAGLQIVMSRMIDARKTFIIGISLIFGLTVDLMPEAFTGVHPWISPIFSSSLSTGALTAVILNLIFRIGIAKKVRLELAPEAQSSERLFEFMEKTGGLWGQEKK